MKNNLQICRFSILKTITEIFFLTIAAAGFPQQVFAQLTDDFSDGDFSDGPAWSGTVSDFSVDNEVLWLHGGSQTGKAYLSLPSSVISGMWDFNAGLDFNPSNANFAQIYLVSDQSDLTGPLHGYYVLVGNTTDDVSLYRQSGTVHTKIIDGKDGLLDADGSNLKISVTHTNDGIWELRTARDGGALSIEGTVLDTVQYVFAFFWCRLYFYRYTC